MAIELDTEQVRKPITDRIATVSIYDKFSTYPSKGLTPERLASLLRDADSGDVSRQMELFEEMGEKDGRIFSAFQKRRLPISTAAYSIVPGSEDNEDQKIASDASEMFARIKGWKNSVSDLCDAVPKGYALQEIFWQASGNRYTIEKLEWIHQKRTRFGMASDPYSDPKDLRLLFDPREIAPLHGIVPESELARASIDGISLDVDPRIRRRFIVSYCKARSGLPARTSLMRTLTYLYLFKNYDIKWWVQFAEVLLGYRIGKYDTSQPDQKELLEKAIAGLATDSAAVISKDSEIEFVEMAQKAQSHLVFGDLKDWCNDEIAEVVLGHVGTIQSTPGKLGQEDAAQESLQKLIESDAEQAIDEPITDQILVPWVIFNYGPREKYPYYKTHVEPPEDLLAKADLMLKVQEGGQPVSKKWSIETFGIPAPDPNDPDDEALQPLQRSSPLLPAKDAALIAADSKKKLLTRR